MCQTDKYNDSLPTYRSNIRVRTVKGTILLHGPRRLLHGRGPVLDHPLALVILLGVPPPAELNDTPRIGAILYVP